MLVKILRRETELKGEGREKAIFFFLGFFALESNRHGDMSRVKHVLNHWHDGHVFLFGLACSYMHMANFIETS